jgi:hypothetical protein
MRIVHDNIHINNCTYKHTINNPVIYVISSCAAKVCCRCCAHAFYLSKSSELDQLIDGYMLERLITARAR